MGAGPGGGGGVAESTDEDGPVPAVGGRHPERVVQRAPGAARAALATIASGHPGTDRSRRPGTAVPDGAHRAGGLGGTVDRRARRGARHPAAVAAATAPARPTV